MRIKYKSIPIILCVLGSPICYANSGIGSPGGFFILTSIAFFIFSSIIYFIGYAIAYFAKKRGETSKFLIYFILPVIIVSIPIIAIMLVGAASLTLGAILGATLTTIFYKTRINRLSKSLIQ